MKIMVVLASILSFFGCQSSGDKYENDTITYFSYYKGGGMRRFDGYRYLVEKTKDGRTHFLFNKDYPDEKEFIIDDASVFDSLQQIVMKHKMYKYSGDYQPSLRIFDGQSWDFYVKYASGASISAEGYMAGPNGYGEAFTEVVACLDQWKKMEVEVNRLASFDFTYISTKVHIEPQGDHALVTVDDETTGRHEVIEKPAELLEDLRVTTITEDLRENGTLRSEDPNCKPFSFDIVFSDGSRYVYDSYDLSYTCHKTEVMFWFLERWEISVNFNK